MRIQDLGGAGLGIFPWKQALFGVADFLGASEWLVRRRGKITDLLLPAVGDIILYQGRGQQVRAFIREKIEEALQNPPVVVMAHSLGGIACVDLLAESPGLAAKDRVKALVTVGSQSPLFYEMNALQSIPYGQAIPPYFPAWQNVYDPRDFLGFVGRTVFPKRVDGSVGIEDVEVENKVSVLDAHSAYWSNPRLWEVILNAFSR